MTALTPFAFTPEQLAPVAFRAAALPHMTPKAEAAIGAMMARDSKRAKTAPRPVPTEAQIAHWREKSRLRRREDQNRRAEQIRARLSAEADRDAMLRREVPRLYAEGMSRTAIVKLLGSSDRKVRAILGNAPAVKCKRPEAESRAVQMRREGLTFKAISEALGMSTRTIQRACREAGL